MITFPTLYKVDSKGKTRELIIEVDDDKYRTISGIVDGAKITTAWTTCTPKNVGRSNETSAAEQANIEATAVYTKKLKEKYVTDVNEIASASDAYFSPMLAYTIKDAKFDVKSYLEVEGNYLIIDPKLDGQRMVEDKYKHLSRKGRAIPAADGIAKSLENFFEKYPNLTLDGELYNHDYNTDFQSLMSLTRKTTITPEEQVLIDSDLEYHVYDVISSNTDLTAIERKALLESLDFGSPKVKKVLGTVVNTYDEYLSVRDGHLEDGYEGSIIRIPDSLYVNKRSKNLLKVKVFEDAEFKVLSIEPGKGNRSDIAGSITVLDTNTNKIFSAGIKGSWEYANQLLINAESYKSGQATIKFFGRSNDGVPRFPILIDLNRPD